ncbi:hypothetical protein BV25DRAFT_1912465 [Artomyces pyxidatus]|uniref:Uncharacterized protein n=1 Tax=Artomyces pyxidatus TaxID=48021 RepID=A0ACB8TFF4_9AGAM|nr:hypothetical protein BV25DRAFT_1912465 [Artomyces pyxidatus]
MGVKQSQAIAAVSGVVTEELMHDLLQTDLSHLVDQYIDDGLPRVVLDKNDLIIAFYIPEVVNNATNVLHTN